MVKYLIVLGWMMVGVPSLAQAELLRDPTMPPAKLGLMVAGAEPAEKPAPVLQSVTLGTAFKSAMINGNTVLLGQQFEGLTLVKLSAAEAVLRAPDGRLQRLKMDYQIDKKPISVRTPPQKTMKKRHAMLHAANESK